MSFDLPADIPVHDVEVLIDNNSKLLETEVSGCTKSFRDVMDRRCSSVYRKTPEGYFTLPPTIVDRSNHELNFSQQVSGNNKHWWQAA
jgi:hypothetical protein